MNVDDTRNVDVDVQSMSASVGTRVRATSTERYYGWDRLRRDQKRHGAG